jgi:hypothetical protein
MFDVTPKFLATLKATPTADLKRIRDCGTDYLEAEDGPAKIVAHLAAKGLKRTEEQAVSSTKQVLVEIEKVLVSRGCR